ncbi:unnamed protein product [Larinioides sclopetarius]|uniref:Transforming acidic coiled-coil-containing protein C-terminal domain-containing protein n=1 Tax=Larinioides sclopetarius TaxID=280406 RepID=A0AAV1ZGQ6_9ARAC
MDDVNVINFERNENRPILDNLKVNDILNGSTESKLSAAESVAFLHNSSLTEKQMLTSVNNNFQNDKPNINFTVSEFPTGVKSNNSAENIASLSLEAGTTKAENFNNSSLVYEAAAGIETSDIISCKSLPNNSRSENELNNDSDTKCAFLRSSEIPVGNMNFPPDALSDEVFSDNQKNLIINAAHSSEMSLTKLENIDSTSTYIEEIKGEKNNSSMVIPDLVDFSFREQVNVSDLQGSLTGIDSLSKKPESFPSNTLEEISGNNLDVNMEENKPLNSSSELLETFTGIDSSSKKLETFPNYTLEEISANNPGVNVEENKPLNSSSELLESFTSIDSSSKKLDSFPNNTLEEISGNNPGVNVEENKPLNSSTELLGSFTGIDSSSKKLEPFPNNTLEEISVNPGVNVEENKSLNSSSELLESFTSIDSSSKKPDSFPNNTLEEISGNNPGADMQEKLLNPSAELLDTDCVNKITKSPTNILKEFGVTDIVKNCNVLGHSITAHSPLRVFENPVQEDDSNVVISDNRSVEFEIPSEAAKETSVVSNSTNMEYTEVNSDETAFQVPENTTSDETDKVSPLKIEKVSFGMSDKSLEEFTDSEFESKASEITCNNPLEQFSDSTFEVPSNNPIEQSSGPDFVFKVPEVPSNNPLEQFSCPDFAFKMPENSSTREGDEQFVDAVQFFKDPNSFQFLENIRTSTVQSRSTVPRSSLYLNFDPLHSKFQTNVPRQDNCSLITAAVQENLASMENIENCSPEVMNKHLVNIAARESLGNILISFDSPKSSTNVDSKIAVQTPTPPKMFTEEEVQQKLKIHELETQEAYLKKQREMEMEIAKRDELLKFQKIVMEEFCGISLKLSDDIRKGQEKIISLEAENEKLKEDLKTSAEDLQSVENTFTDFYKRYEQCKGMLKTYKDNEEHLKQTISDLHTKAKEQEQMYHMLQERTEEMLEKANVEVDNVKRSGEAQVTVLKAQLKKAEMKISSLESDIKQIKMENSELGGICDDLMAKVSKS